LGCFEIPAQLAPGLFIHSFPRSVTGKTTQVISKYIITSVWALCSCTAIAVLWMSIGWYLPIFSVVLIPSIIIQVLAGIRAFRFHPVFRSWVLLAGFAFLAFTLLRPDTDAHGQYSGYGVLMFQLGLSDTEHTEPWRFSLELALVLLLAQIFINTYILRSAPRQKDK
jgi:hypothetical protein